MEYKRVTTKGNGLRGIDGKLVNQRQKPLDVFEEAFNIAVTRLAELEDKIENGTLIELPCKVGDTVYVLCRGDYVLVGKKTGWQYTIKEIKFTLSVFSTWEYGNTLFLTKAEAEEKLLKLKELKGEV